MKIEIWYAKKVDKDYSSGYRHTYGIGDGVHDGMYVDAGTQGQAAILFIQKLNHDEQYGVGPRKYFPWEQEGGPKS